jgi:hypothetical protein
MACNCAAWGADPFSSEKFETYVREWGEYVEIWDKDEPDGLPFSTRIFKNKLLNEIGDDPHAIAAFEFFHQHHFLQFVDHCVNNLVSMLQNNAERFKDLLITSAPVINFVENSASCIRKIIDIAKGSKNVHDHVPTFSQFCYEMLFCVMVDTEDTEPEGTEGWVISQACERLCCEIDLTGPLAKGERRLLEIVGLRESEEGSECKEYFELKWLQDPETASVPARIQLQTQRTSLQFSCEQVLHRRTDPVHIASAKP